MALFQSISLLANSLFAIHRQKPKDWVYFLFYTSSGLFIFALFSYLLLTNQELIKQQVLDYLLPSTWQGLSEHLIDFFYASQAKAVIGNLILSGSLVISSIFLFPIKEQYSAQVEKSLSRHSLSAKEFPLWKQGLEETRLFLFYVAAQLTILWIGYYPFKWANWLSIGLSYLFLFYTFALDLISPTFQRHRIKYSMINKLLSSRLFLSLGYGLVFSVPSLLISRWILSIESLTLPEMISILFLANFIAIAMAIPAGTYLATCWLAQVDKQNSVSKAVKLFGYGAGLSLLIAGLTLHFILFRSLHHKSQVLKADYDIDWSSFAFNYSSLGPLFSTQSQGKLELALEIHNTTPYDIQLEPSVIYLFKKKDLISQINIQGFNVSAGESQKIQLRLNSDSNLSPLMDWSEALTGWRMDLHIQLLPGIPFIVNLIDQEP